MNGLSIKFLLLILLTAPFIEDTKLKTMDIEERIAVYFSLMNAKQRTEKIIGDVSTGNEVGYDCNNDTTYYLIDVNKDKMPDLIKWYDKKEKIWYKAVIN